MADTGLNKTSSVKRTFNFTEKDFNKAIKSTFEDFFKWIRRKLKLNEKEIIEISQKKDSYGAAAELLKGKKGVTAKEFYQTFLLIGWYMGKRREKNFSSVEDSDSSSQIMYI